VYIPTAFKEERPERLVELVRAHPLATLVTLGSEGLAASHLPMLYEPAAEGPGMLHGHLAKANPQWKDLREGVEALAIFHGPQVYISPSWYVTKQETGRVVPTWNYAVVHAYGTLEVYSDGERLRAHLAALTASQEGRFERPWSIDDAPAEFVEGMQRAVVGVSLRIRRWEGKWKMSQNRPAADREAVVAALRAQGGEASVAVAELVKELNGL
jgi:transcriptional regulator